MWIIYLQPAKKCCFYVKKNQIVKLESDFYQQSNVDLIAKKLLGKYLVSNFGNILTSGMIVETEAYAGVTDKASHAYNGRRTKRTEIMYRAGGVCYVYLIYGIHSLFNVITNKTEVPHAVLVRAIEPADGLQEMMLRRGLSEIKKNLCAGPGLLTQALAISTTDTGVSLLENLIWIEDRGTKITQAQIIASPRIGIDYAAEHALLNKRYRIKNNPWTSAAK